MSNIINEDDKIITDRILNALSSNNIQNYLINTVITTSDESFYVLKNNVLSRNKYTVKSTVTIYNDFDDENNKYRGSFSFTADLNMDEEAKKNRVRILSEQLFKIGNNKRLQFSRCSKKSILPSSTRGFNVFRKQQIKFI